MFADIILPLAVPTCYTYSVPDAMIHTIKVGMLVNVPLGKSRHYNGIVLKIHSECKVGINYKPIEKMVLPQPILTENQIHLWQWIAEYYMCKLGDVLKAAIPTALYNAEYKPQSEAWLRLATDEWSKLFGNRKPTDKQKTLLDRLSESNISMAEAQSLVSVAVISGLIKKGAVERYYVDKSRFSYSAPLTELHKLSDAQQIAYNSVSSFFAKDHKPVLLHGITSSGKTEIYVKLIDNVVKNGGQVLYLVPEIALTTQLTERLRAFFGDKMLVYHSKLNEQERAEVYKDILDGSKYSIVLGVRSAVFLPFKNLKLVVVDEQHDASYKQQEPAPRYNAVNCAIMLASMYKANTLLGSATPSIEGYYNAVSGKWHLVELNKRFKDIEPPETIVVDMRAERSKRKVTSMFSWILRDKIIEAVSAGEQVILFHNRRGYSSQVHCEACGWVPMCDSCSVSMTYHKGSNSLECHYCGKRLPMPQKCPVCGGEISAYGYGTEQVESVIHDFLPDARVLRLDLDTTKGKNSYKNILEKFARHEADILLGTQMVSKGLDFEGVSLVGIINADTLLDYPDFRSTEFSYQTLLQVSGRSGRAHKRGEVVFQSSHVEYPIVGQIITSDYKGFYKEQIEVRRLFSYPPFSRVIFISLKSRNINAVQGASKLLVSYLSEQLKGMVLGPEIPPISKIREYNIRRIMVKIPVANSVSAAKIAVIQAIERMNRKYSMVSTIIDVDPI
ncbi:MAG: primosomal protein N' [Paludibacteraceae bacterium]|nr:primosomal protein N' [Paludibacteraceae bacterium]